MTIATDERRGYVGEWRLTLHAMKRMVQRNVTLDMIARALDDPQVTRARVSGVTTYVAHGCRVVANPLTKEIITVAIEDDAPAVEKPSEYRMVVDAGVVVLAVPDSVKPGEDWEYYKTYWGAWWEKQKPGMAASMWK